MQVITDDTNCPDSDTRDSWKWNQWKPTTNTIIIIIGNLCIIILIFSKIVLYIIIYITVSKCG